MDVSTCATLRTYLALVLYVLLVDTGSERVFR